MKILFLCNANMCRSPIAEALLRLIFKKRNIDAVVDSAGFEAYHINEQPEDWAIQKAHELGVDISTKRVRLFTQADFDTFDKIYVMDNYTYSNAIFFSRNENDKRKVEFLMNVISPGKNEPIPAPFFGSQKETDQAIEVISKACHKIADAVSVGQLNQ